MYSQPDIYPYHQLNSLFIENGEGEELTIENSLAQIICKVRVKSRKFRLELSGWEQGMYFCRLGKYSCNFKLGYFE